MARPFPYTYISCPCADASVAGLSRRRDASPKIGSSAQSTSPDANDSDEEKDFDLRSPRSNFSLYPPEQLLYCEDCHQIKCPRCITEEIVCWYCPNCLFETPSSMVRSEGNRCARNCFNCPICTAPLAVSTLETEGGSQQGPWVLSCGYCMWTTLDIGVKFDKPTNIRTQLSKMTEALRGRQHSKAPGDSKSRLATPASSIDDSKSPPGQAESKPADDDQPALDHDARFAALKAFYRNQLAEMSATPVDPLGADFSAGFSSPSALNRIMSIYASSTLSGLYGGNAKKSKSRPRMMREAQSPSDGLKLPAADADEAIIQRMALADCGWDGIASLEQRAFQSPNARFVDDLLPLPVLLRTKRSKRCKSCKHILVKPEFKPQSTRFRMRLIALSYIPLPTLQPLVPPLQPSGLSPSLSLPSLSSSPAPGPKLDLNALSPLKPFQLLLTLKNHMFDPIRVTLGTPPVTPGRVQSKVTILCPQFEIGANSDVWDETLLAPPPPVDPRLSSKPAAAPDGASAGSGYEKVAEAGKAWDKGRNWTTVVLELVPGTLPGSARNKGPESQTRSPADGEVVVQAQQQREESRAAAADDDDHDDDDASVADELFEAEDEAEDEDVLEIPVFVRLEWDSEENQADQPVGKAEMVRRELAYWMVLGVGRIKPDEGAESRL